MRTLDQAIMGICREWRRDLEDYDHPALEVCFETSKTFANNLSINPHAFMVVFTLTLQKSDGFRAKASRVKL